MIDPLSVLLCIPTYDGMLHVPCVGGLTACASAHLFADQTYVIGVPHSLARNSLAHTFLKSSKKHEWLVFIDADIGFSERDFRMLMNYPPYDLADYPNAEGTTVTDDGYALIVNAEYAKKKPTYEACRFGLGFTRIHRSVFERLDALSHEHGAPIIEQYMDRGRLTSHYFIQGVIDAGNWRSEDTGFFLLCRMAGIVPRIEMSTQLYHYGRGCWTYKGPNAAPVEQIYSETDERHDERHD